MAKKEYDTFCDDLTLLKEGEEIEIAIREMDIYRTRLVKAVVYSSPDKLPDGDNLWIRYNRGNLRPSPWKIKIIKDLPGLLKKERKGDN